jgi:hypothetical protein
MPLQRLTLDRMSCFANGFPLLGTTEYPHATFTVANVSPLLGTTEYPQAHFAPCGLVGIAIPVPLIQQDKLTRAFLIS